MGHTNSIQRSSLPQIRTTNTSNKNLKVNTTNQSDTHTHTSLPNDTQIVPQNYTHTEDKPSQPPYPYAPPKHPDLTVLSANEFTIIKPIDWNTLNTIEYTQWALSRLINMDTHSLLSIPIFIIILCILLIEFLIYITIRLLVPICEMAYFKLISGVWDVPDDPLSVYSLQSADIPMSDWYQTPHILHTHTTKHTHNNTHTQNNTTKTTTATQTTHHPTHLSKHRKKTYIASIISKRQKIHFINQKRIQSHTFFDYAYYSKELDDLVRRTPWKFQEDSNLFDCYAVKKRLKQMVENRQNGDISGLISTLKHCVHYEFAGVFNERLYSKTYVGTKHIVELFIAEIVHSMDWLCDHILPNYVDEIRTLLHHISSQWGSTSLVLSGGAALGLYHFGVCDVLINQSPEPELDDITTKKHQGNLLPRIICGTSAGAAVAAWICTRTDYEVKNLLNPEYLSTVFRGFSPNNWLIRIWNIITKGYMCDVEIWQQSMYELFGTITFLEAYERTGRILNISMTRADRYEPALVLSYKNAPNVLIFSAVLASMSFPFLGLPFHLKEKLPETSEIVDSREFESAYFHDGSLRGDVPINTLKDKWGTKFTIVSQVNAHVFLFFGLRAHGEAGMPINWRGSQGQWRAGFLLSGLEVFFKENMRFLLRLIALLDLSPTLRGINCGNLALQSYSGDVTIHPSSLKLRHLKLANDPTLCDVEWYMKEGRRMAFPKLSFIINRVRIDRALERLYEKAFFTSPKCTHTQHPLIRSATHFESFMVDSVFYPTKNVLNTSKTTKN